MAAEALGPLGDPRAVEPLVKALGDRNWEVREAAVLALGHYRDARAVDPIVALLSDPDREVREAAARVLEQIGDPRAVGPLVLTLKDAEDTVRQAAGRALTALDPNWESSDAARAVVPQLKAALKDKEYWVRQSAASVLAKIGELRPTESDTAMLAQPIYYRRQAAIELLVNTLGDFDRELRIAAAEALGRLGQQVALHPLAQALRDDDVGVRTAAAQALELLHGKPTPETSVVLRGGHLSQ
jgi:HEAT repeat protein